MNDDPVAGDDVVSPELLSARRRPLPESGAERSDLADVSYTTIDSPLGPLLLAATPQGLARVAYALEDHDEVLRELSHRLGSRVLHAPEPLAEVTRQLGEYFAGDRRVFDLTLDRSLSRGFRRLVQTRLPEIGYGQTRSYSEMARLVGNPKAVRAVGTACATNPLPIIVPCHRIVHADGSPGAYVGGPDAKKALLRLEAG